MDPITEKALRDVVRVQKMDNETARREILKYEEWADENLALGNITQEEAWDIYFCLLHECDERGLLDDRKRIAGKIDAQTYKPLNSADPGVRFIAQLRARALGLIRAELS